jgi:hypothetical protein
MIVSSENALGLVTNSHSPYQTYRPEAFDRSGEERSLAKA